MAIIHKTTMTPTKLELLTPWLAGRPWYLGTENGPDLAKAGGFRLDDPQGEVGIEFLVAADVAGDRPIAYHLPLTYRGAPLDGADEALVGTAEHGVLGTRWVYDGVHDPVLLDRLLALLQGRAEPQAQSVSDTPDPTVAGRFTGAGLSMKAGPSAVADGPAGTDVTVETTADAGGSAGPLVLRVVRVLEPDQDGAAGAHRGHVTAGWRLPGDGEHRGRLVVVRDTES